MGESTEIRGKSQAGAAPYLLRTIRFNHYAYGVVGEFLYGTVADLDLDASPDAVRQRRLPGGPSAARCGSGFAFRSAEPRDQPLGSPRAARRTRPSGGRRRP